jgi:hypothetical protein
VIAIDLLEEGLGVECVGWDGDAGLLYAPLAQAVMYGVWWSAPCAPK